MTVRLAAMSSSGRYGRAAIDPSVAFLAEQVTASMLGFVDERGGIDKCRRTDLSAQSDGRSVSPARCFTKARDETVAIDDVSWQFFAFNNKEFGFLSRCEDALRSIAGLQSFKVGITRYTKRRWENPRFGYVHEGYTGMLIMAYAAMGAGALERDAMAFFRGHP